MKQIIPKCQTEEHKKKRSDSVKAKAKGNKSV